MPSTVPDPSPDAVIHVAAGILRDPRGRVLIARRRPDSHQGDKWEFPGGKLQAQESVQQGLKRELREELGVVVQDARPFMQVQHTYPDKKVLLDVWHVTRYRGEIVSREHQPLQWVMLRQFDDYEFPAADRPVIDALRFPPLYLITDSQRMGPKPFLHKLEQALAAGAELIQLREHHLTRVDYQAYAQEVVALCRRYGARLLVNAMPETAEACGADGVHLTAQRLMALAQRPLGRDYWVAASCHNAEEVAHAARISVDFVVVAPVKATVSHPASSPLGWQRFADLCKQAPMPVYALGGLRPSDLERARAAGGQGIAMISGIWEASSIADAVIAAQIMPSSVFAQPG